MLQYRPALDMEDLIQKAMNQNFVPGCRRWRKIYRNYHTPQYYEYCYEKLKKMDKNS